MIFSQMKSEVELLYESLNSSSAPGFTSTEWGQILTVAQRKVVKDILDEGLTRNSSNMLAIEYLVRPTSYTAFTTETHFKNSDGTAAKKLLITGLGSQPFDSKFFWILDEYLTTALNANIPVKRITYDFYRINIDNPFRTPDATEGYWMVQYQNAPVFITDGTVITGYNIIGVYHPDNYPINSTNNCLLNEGVHSRIVEVAVKLARMSVVDAQGYQLALNEFSK